MVGSGSRIGPASQARRPPPWTRLDAVLLGILVVVATLLRWAAQRKLDVPLESDALSYFTMAKNLHDGRGLVDQYGQLAFMNAGYPFFMVGLWALFGSSIWVVKASSLALAAGTVALIYVTAAYLWASRWAAFVAAGAWAVFFESINAAGYLYKENLMCFLVALQVFLVVLYDRSGRRTLLSALLGAAVGAQALVGSAGLAIVPALLWQVYRQSRSATQAVRQVAVVALCAAVVVAPWLYRNQLVLGHPTLNTNFGFNLYIGNNAEADGHFMSIAETPIGTSGFHALLDSRGEYDAYAHLAQLAEAYMLQHPVRTVALGIKKAVLFWAPPNPAGAASTTEALARAANYAEHWFLVGAFAVFAAWSALRDRRYLFLVLCVLLYTVAHMPFYPFARYRLSIMPVVCLGAGFTVDWILRLAWRRWPRLPGGAVPEVQAEG